MKDDFKEGLTLRQAFNKSGANYKNANVMVWAKPIAIDGTQVRFTLDSEAFIGLDCPESFAEVWHLHSIEVNRRTKSEADILEIIHGFYRIPLGMTNPASSVKNA